MEAAVECRFYSINRRTQSPNFSVPGNIVIGAGFVFRARLAISRVKIDPWTARRAIPHFTGLILPQ